MEDRAFPSQIPALLGRDQKVRVTSSALTQEAPVSSPPSTGWSPAISPGTGGRCRQGGCTSEILQTGLETHVPYGT